MSLNELIRELEVIKDKIEKFKKELAESEALTRYALVDPVLRALGWDVFDPEQVRPEFPTEQGRPDYALLWEGKPLIMVEVKPLHANLGPAKDKGFNYCWKNKVRYFAITDGERWEVYDMKEMGGEVIAVANLSENLGHAARQLLALWRPAMPELRPAPPPIWEKAPEQPKLVHIPKAENFVSLAEFWEMIKAKKVKPGSRPPSRILFPDGKETTLNRWIDIFRATVEWTEGRLKNKLPLLTSKNMVLVDTSSGKMRHPVKVGNLYVNLGLAIDYWYSVRYAMFVLEKAGINPNEVKVELSAQK